jgi:hypothetical protein
MPVTKKTEDATAVSAGLPLGMDSHLPWWLRAIVILGALLMAAGALIALIHPALLVSPDAHVNEAVRVYAGYLFSRNLAIAAMLLVTLAIGAANR